MIFILNLPNLYLYINSPNPYLYINSSEYKYLLFYYIIWIQIFILRASLHIPWSIRNNCSFIEGSNYPNWNMHRVTWKPSVESRLITEAAVSIMIEIEKYNVVIKTKISNLVHTMHTTRFWNKLHQVRSKSKDRKAK